MGVCSTLQQHIFHWRGGHTELMYQRLVKIYYMRVYKYVSVWINFTKLSRRINFGFCSLPSLAFFMHSFGSFFSLTFGITSFILNLIHEKMCIIVSNMIHGFYVTKNKPQKIESVTISITRNVTESNNWLCQLTK